MGPLTFRQTSLARWLTVCVACLALAFVANTIYSRNVASRIDAQVHSIADNDAASVVYLAKVTEDIRLISTRAVLTRKDTAAADRATIDAWLADMDDAIDAYRLTEDHPDEYDLYATAEVLRAPFVAAIEGALDGVQQGRLLADTELRSMTSAADNLAFAIRELTRHNADEVASDGATIQQIGDHARLVFTALRGVTLVLAVAGIALGLTASRQYVALLDDRRRLAEARAGELEMFAGRVAHDLRAPLAVIELKSSARNHGQTLDTLNDALDRVQRQGRRMSEMINALLAFAQSGAKPEPGSCTEIARVVDEITADSRSMIGDAAIEFVVEPIPEAAAACSQSVLGIVLSNLVNNAAKHATNGHGPGRITIRVRDQVHPKWIVRFEVEDNGPGLPPGTERMVFEPFVRVHGASGGGIGLGLATVKRLVEAHHGSVGVDSSPGRGCRFWFELPAATLTREASPASEARPLATGRRPTRALQNESS